jgi:hypothetical protein
MTCRPASKAYWEEANECDLCGRFTHGEVFEDQPDVVWCDSCHLPLIGNPVSVAEGKQQLSSTPPHWGKEFP